MLTLERKVGEKIIINGNIVITVRRWCPKYNGVYLDIEAPKDVPIDRMEIHVKKQLSKHDWRNNG
jgi:carbon storage regulator CsrA